MEIVAEAIDIARNLHDLAHRRLRELRRLRLRLRRQRRRERCGTGKPACAFEQVSACESFGGKYRIVVAAARAMRVFDIGGVAADEAGNAGHGASDCGTMLILSIQKSRLRSNTIA
jgi:hypothetical protein